MRKVTFVIGVVAALLGLLWLLQGLGIVHVRPILCFADCAPIRGSSPTWAAIGAVMTLVGALGVVYSLKTPSARSGPTH
jgi:hypothetical protein